MSSRSSFLFHHNFIMRLFTIKTRHYKLQMQNTNGAKCAHAFQNPPPPETLVSIGKLFVKIENRHKKVK